MLPSEIPRLATDPLVKVFPGVWKLLSLFKTPFPGWISIPTSFVSLFIFYILSYLLLKTMGCLFGCLMSSASIQKLFCGICSAFKCSFDELVEEKVVSLSYSSTILGPSHLSLRAAGSLGLLRTICPSFLAWHLSVKLFFSFLFLDFPGGSDGKASAYNAGDPGSIPGLGRSCGEGNGNPLQYSCLDNPMDRGAL